MRIWRWNPRHALCIGFSTQVFLLYLSLLVSVTAYIPLTDDTLGRLPQPSLSDFDIHTGALLSPILIPRVPGTPGSATVLTHFVDFFTTHLPDWTLSFQNSTSTTPIHGSKLIPFTNLIATRNPPNTLRGDVGYLTLVAHYDSKLTPSGFLGATDSAAPCAMILHAVRAIDSALTRKWSSPEYTSSLSDTLDFEHHGVQVLLLDGEEAFLAWTGTDSTYGARSLAEAWDTTPYPALSTYRTPLESITLFLLLDLLGAPAPRIPSYFKTTHWAYQHLARLESRLRALNLLKSAATFPWLPDGDRNEHTALAFPSYIMEDDHIPFIERGVEVLHLIPSSFPTVWHTMDDDGEHLDMPTVLDWALLTSAFVAEWMELEGFVGGAGTGVGGAGSVKRDEQGGSGGSRVISKTEL